MGTGIFLADGNTQDASIMWVYTYWVSCMALAAGFSPSYLTLCRLV